jgi:hypothetical protein
VNTSDLGYAYIVPDIFGLNDNPAQQNRYLTTEQIQSLRMVGASNSTGSGALIAFFPIGRVFDRGYSSTPYQNGYSYNVVSMVPGKGGSSGTTNQYMFQFGPFTGGNDNGTGVGYDNIPAGEITEIKTGLTFTAALEGELDYFWNNQKNYSAQIGDIVNLNLNYMSYNNSYLDDVGFRVDFRDLQIHSTGCVSSGFEGGISNCTAGNDFYQLSGATVFALENSDVSVPVKITQAGQWVIDGSAITNTTQTLPLGTPATLTVPTSVSLTDTVPSRIYRGDSKTVTVIFPETVTAIEDVTIYLTYEGDVSAFASLPASVTIPAGSNSATFIVTALPTSEGNSYIYITLSHTDKSFITVAEPSSNLLTIEYEPEEVAVCEGEWVTFVATPVNGGDSPTYQWKKNNINIEGATDARYAYIPHNGDRICCEMTSNTNCTFPITVFSPTIIVVITPCMATVTGTVFPFINWNYPAIDTLFKVTVNLKSVPNPASNHPFKEIMDENPLYSTIAVYYNGTAFVPNSPKYAGMVGALNNYGLPINWQEAIGVQGSAPLTDVLNEEEKPNTVSGATLGLFTFENVKKGDYILEIIREGFVTRWAKINVNANEQVNYAGHRELIPGDLNNDLFINQWDATQMLPYIGGKFQIPSTNYNPIYDLNADGKVDQLDYNLILKFSGFWFYHYEETMEWINELGLEYSTIMNISNSINN